MRSQRLKLLTLPAVVAGLTVLGMSAVNSSERARATVSWLSSELDWLAEVQQSTRQARKNETAVQPPIAAEVVEARVRPIAEVRAAAEVEVVEARARPIEGLRATANAEVVEARARPIGELRAATAQVVAPVSTANIVSIGEVRARLAAVKTSAPRANDAGEPNSAEHREENETVANRVAGIGALMASASVPSDQLGKLRGGFETPGGLRLNFGIERVVMINGVLQSTTILRVDELGKLVGGKAAGEAIAAGNTLAVIQSGPNNVVTAPLPGTTLATVVQNSLNNQKIQSVTTINATINSAEVMRQVRMQHSVQEALSRAALMR